MKTGEGKTLTATLAVFLNTLAGDSVHVVTVNDYLARRDAEWMAPVYDALGVTVAAIQDGDAPPTRRESTRPTSPTGPTPSSASTTSATTWRARSRTASARPRLRVVDEVDTILIDEARTPLIISGKPEQAADTYYRSPAWR